VGDPQSENPAGHREQRGLGQQLSQNAPPAGPNGQADRDLLLSQAAARKKHVGRVERYDQQQYRCHREREGHYRREWV
jgi:hypothetical protein